MCAVASLGQIACWHAAGVMYTCDAFGAHFCEEDPFDSRLEPLSPHFRFYYDCLMRPNARSVLTALRKVPRERILLKCQPSSLHVSCHGHNPSIFPSALGSLRRCSHATGSFGR